MLNAILEIIICAIFMVAFYGAVLVVGDKQREWNARHKK